jgi:hypothetical protein
VLIVRSPTAREGGMRAWWLGAGYLIAALYWMTPEIGPAVLLVGAVVGALWIPFGVAAWKLLRPPVTWPRALAAGEIEMEMVHERLVAGQRLERVAVGEGHDGLAEVGLGLLGRQTVQAAAGNPLAADFSHSLEPLWIGRTESWLLGERASSRDFLSRQTLRERIAT